MPWYSDASPTSQNATTSISIPYSLQVYGIDIKHFTSSRDISDAIYDNVGAIDSAVVFTNDTSYEV